jgi:hypothetical protein
MVPGEIVGPESLVGAVAPAVVARVAAQVLALEGLAAVVVVEPEIMAVPAALAVALAGVLEVVLTLKILPEAAARVRVTAATAYLALALLFFIGPRGTNHEIRMD